MFPAKVKTVSPGPLFMTIVLKMVATIMLILFTAGFAPASAGPLFCSDAPHFPLYVLTGCATKANQPPVFAGARSVDKASSFGASQAVEDALSHTSPHQLVQVGPHGLPDATPGENAADQDSPATAEIEGNLSETHTNTQDVIASTITQEGHWYYMNIDQDGTHIFLGDVDQLDEWMSSEEPDDLLPQGIGIGKRWQF